MNMQSNTFPPNCFAELGEASLIILQFLPIKDLGSIILTNKKWTLSKYATHNILWEEYFTSQYKSQKYSKAITNKTAEIQNILDKNSDDKYKRAMDRLYQLLLELIANQKNEIRKLIQDNTVKRKQRQYYGIPSSVKYLHLAKPNDNGLLKVLFTGDGAVGKTCMLVSYTTKKFPEDYVPTIYDNYSTPLTVDGFPANIFFWDTGGPDDHGRLRLLSYPQSELFVLCFSVVNPTSFVNIAIKWIPELQHRCPDTPILLVGTKIDLRNNKDMLKKLEDRGSGVISKEEGEHMAKQCGCIGYIENSSKTQENLNETFDAIVRCLGKYYADPKTVAKTEKKSGCKSQ